MCRYLQFCLQKENVVFIRNKLDFAFAVLTNAYSPAEVTILPGQWACSPSSKSQDILVLIINIKIPTVYSYIDLRSMLGKYK